MICTKFQSQGGSLEFSLSTIRAAAFETFLWPFAGFSDTPYRDPSHVQWSIEIRTSKPFWSKNVRQPRQKFWKRKTTENKLYFTKKMKWNAFLSSENDAIENSKANRLLKITGLRCLQYSVLLQKSGRNREISNRSISSSRRSWKLIRKYVGSVLILSNSSKSGLHRTTLKKPVDNLPLKTLRSVYSAVKLYCTGVKALSCIHSILV